MKVTKRALATVVAFMFSLSLILTNGAQMVKAETQNLTKEIMSKKSLEKLKNNVQANDKFSGLEQAEFDTENVVLKTEGNPEETIRVIVEVSGEPAITKFSTIDEDNINYVIENQEDIQTQVEEITDNDIKNSYGNLINGFSIDVKRKDIGEIASIPGVEKVTEATIYYPTMSTAVDLTEAREVWESYGYEGEGLVVAIIDTGIDYTHKDMRLSNPESAKITDTNLEGPGKYYTEKIPYGYNFADDNDQIIDTTSSMHGMHVAGIVASNATDEDVANDTGIRGVAPEAQLLAMKVFTNDPSMSGAYSDDIIAAIEDSVLHGADIINMSLGSSAGYKDENDPEQIAIKRATDAGTICVVSAGNSSYSTDPYWFGEIKDISTVGSPGLAEDALQVASYENNNVRLQAFKLYLGDKGSLIGHTTADINPADVFTEDERLEVVDCGLGKVEELEDKELEGKVALIERGEIAFTEKALNAQEAGAVAVVIYNNAANGDAYINMATDPSIKIPYIFVSNTDGLKIKESIANDGRIGFGYYDVSVSNSESGRLSSFTSWGPAPNLDFAPQITGPGGNIYSTLNNNTYGSMSGTSMSAPHVAGATTLIVEALKKAEICLEGRELVEFVKNSIINTAEILYDNEMYDKEDGIPYSPRRQGSGMIQTKNAIENRVLALGEDGKATISLKEIGNTTTFSITLKNYSTSDAVYKVTAPCGVLTTINPGFGITNYMAADEIIEGATINFDKEEVVVPASGQVTVTATLNIPEDVEKNIFAEGYIKFINNNNEDLSLVVPYMGFYGDWSAEKIINDFAWDFNANNILPASFAAVKLLGDYNYAGYVGRDEQGNVVLDENIIAISPNEDELADTLIPALYPLRNAKSISVNILDVEGNLVAENVNYSTDVRKKIFNTSNGSGQQASIMNYLLWDGKLYNKTTGKYEVIPGKYYISLNSKVDIETATEQTILIPVKVDIQAPEIEIISQTKTEDTSYELKFKLSEDLSGLQEGSLVVAVNGNIIKVASDNIVNNEVTLNVELNNNSLNTIEVGVYDNAYNFGYESIEVLSGEIPYEQPKLELNIEEGQEFTTNNITVKGKVTGDYGKVVIAGKEITPAEDGTFSIDLALEEGRNYISLYVEDINGKVVINYAKRVYCDTEAPIINITSPVVQEGNVIVTPVNGIVLKGSVSDNTMGYTFDINGERILTVQRDGLYGSDETRQEFYKEMNINNGDIIELKATDMFGNITLETYTVKVDENVPIVEVKDFESNDQIVNNGLYNKDINLIVSVSEGYKIISTKLNNEDYTDEKITKDGKYSLRITVALDREEDTRSVEDTIDYVVNFEIDKTAPVITVNGVEDGISYNTSVTPLVTTNEETKTEYKLNGEAYDLATVVDEGQYTLEIISTDNAGNVSTKTIVFEIDKTAPIITISDIVNGSKYDKEVKPNISVNDENANVVITLNNNAYDGKAIKEDGKYVLKVVATDITGNSSEKIIEFEIKLPVKDNTNPTPNPGENDTTIGDGTTNDTTNSGTTNTNKKPTNNLKNEKLPATGQDSIIYVVGAAVILLIIGAVLVIRKKKSEEKL